MISDWKSNEFKIAINMAGAVSAGAYTAGVLDFLIEALEEWEKAKVVARTAFLNGAQAVSSDQLAPLHNVSIEAFSGASAGGMCAAIASVMVQRPFQHVTSKEVKNTNNTFYEAWVNQIDISELLGTKDLANRQPLVSLLDSTAIDQIAQSALTPTTFTRSAYISEALTLFLTLTNVRGVPYRLYADPSPGLDEFTTYYADRIRFEIVQPGRSVSCSLAKPLPLSEPQGFAWNLLKEAAKATGAFPLFLAPRVLKRDLSDYAVPPWIPISEAEPIPPIISDLPEPPPSGIETLNVDGGVTDNDPFDLAHDFLASHNPEATSDAPPTNPRSPLKANCAVISVAPFPSADRYDRKYDVSVAQGILRMAGRLVTVLISQSRFFGESLALITGKATFSRFVIAPSDSRTAPASALQCGSLSAFGGFMARGFRAHDFLLGRRNCQRFLQIYFRLPVSNPIIAAGLASAGGDATTILTRFVTGPPPGIASSVAGSAWVPIIPLIGTALDPILSPERGTITKKDVTEIAELALGRLNAIKAQLLGSSLLGRLLRLIIGLACTWPIRLLTRRKIATTLAKYLEQDK